MAEKTYKVTATWDSGKPSGQGSFTKTGKTAAEVQEIREQVRAWAPPGSTHSVIAESE